MLTRFTQRLGLWMSLCLLVAATVSVAMAEAAARADEGKVEAIEIIYSAPDNKPVNNGTVDRRPRRRRDRPPDRERPRENGGDRRRRSRWRGRRKRNREKAGAATTPRYRITVRLDSGSSLIVEDTRDLNLRVGDRVRIENGHLTRI